MEHLSADVARLLLRGQYDAAARAKWEAHVERCDRCRALVAAEQSWAKMLNLAEAPAAPEGGAERLVERLTELDVLTPPPLRVWPIFLGAAVMSGIAALAIYLVRQGDGGASAAASARELGISEAAQRRVIENAAALEALRTDPWLADEYDVLRTLVDQLNRSAPVESASISQTPGAIGE